MQQPRPRRQAQARGHRHRGRSCGLRQQAKAIGLPARLDLLPDHRNLQRRLAHRHAAPPACPPCAAAPARPPRPVRAAPGSPWPARSRIPRASASSVGISAPGGQSRARMRRSTSARIASQPAITAPPRSRAITRAVARVDRVARACAARRCTICRPADQTSVTIRSSPAKIKVSRIVSPRAAARSGRAHIQRQQVGPVARPRSRPRPAPPPAPRPAPRPRNSTRPVDRSCVGQHRPAPVAQALRIFQQPQFLGQRRSAHCCPTPRRSARPPPDSARPSKMPSPRLASVIGHSPATAPVAASATVSRGCHLRGVDQAPAAHRPRDWPAAIPPGARPWRACTSSTSATCSARWMWIGASGASARRHRASPRRLTARSECGATPSTVSAGKPRQRRARALPQPREPVRIIAKAQLPRRQRPPVAAALLDKAPAEASAPARSPPPPPRSAPTSRPDRHRARRPAGGADSETRPPPHSPPRPSPPSPCAAIACTSSGVSRSRKRYISVAPGPETVLPRRRAVRSSRPSRAERRGDAG